MNSGIRFLAVILILVVGWMLATWAKRATLAALSHLPIDTTLKPLLASLIRYAILVVTLVLVMDQFGVQTTSLIAVLGAAGIAIGLALQGTLSNVAAGVMLLLLRPFRVGQFVEVNNQQGTVRE
ncbi:MAG TPA: mechanosensitive ion channel domain-containing protein, partial [Rhizomicrobium sp.]